MVQIDIQMPSDCYSCWVRKNMGCKIANDSGWLNNKRDDNCLLKEQEEEPNANGWISVKDRLPEKEGQYLCWFGKNTMAKGAAIATYLEEWKSFGSLESLETYPNVTHWMPIESPEEVKLNET